MNLGSNFSDQIIGGAIALTFGALFWASVIAPVSQWRAASLLRHEVALTEQARLNTSTLRLKSELDFLSQSESQGFVWQAEQSGAVTAKIQSSLNTLASRAGIALRSISPAPEIELPYATGAAFRLESEATLDQILKFILSIEFNKEALLIERATLRRLNRPNRTSQQPLLFFQLDILAPVLIGGRQ